MERRIESQTGVNFGNGQFQLSEKIKITDFCLELNRCAVVLANSFFGNKIN